MLSASQRGKHHWNVYLAGKPSHGLITEMMERPSLVKAREGRTVSNLEPVISLDVVSTSTPVKLSSRKMVLTKVAPLERSETSGLFPVLA